MNKGEQNDWGIYHLLANVAEWIYSKPMIFEDEPVNVAGGSWDTKAGIEDIEKRDPYIA